MSDCLGILASPLYTIVRTTRDDLFAQILATIIKEEIKVIVLGLPIGLEGQETETTRQVRNFAKSLERRTDLPIYFEDERFSSQIAESQLKETGRCKQKTKIDSQAATIILQAWLEKRKVSLKK